MKKYQNLNHTGHYFVMRFDSSAAIQDQIQYTLSGNPHMIRFSVVKLGDKLKGNGNQKGGMEDIPGKVEWVPPRVDYGLDIFTGRHS